MPPRERHRLVVVPLGLPDALERIEGIDKKAETNLFLDAFDEDAKAIQGFFAYPPIRTIPAINLG